MPGQQVFSYVGTFSRVEPALSNEDEVSCSRTQHRAPGEKNIKVFLLKITILTAMKKWQYIA